MWENECEGNQSVTNLACRLFLLARNCRRLDLAEQIRVACEDHEDSREVGMRQ